MVKHHNTLDFWKNPAWANAPLWMTPAAVDIIGELLEERDQLQKDVE